MNIDYKTIDEQIEMLKAKGILIKNEENAKKILIRENYYNLITGYKNVFIDIKNSNKRGVETFDEETYFEEIYAVYIFDRELRNLMLKYISFVETNMKSYCSEVFSKNHGAKNYLKAKYFNVNTKNEEGFGRLVRTIQDNISRNLENYPNIKQCKQEHGIVPLWMAVTLLTFGAIIKFYTYMKEEDKIEVASFAKINYREMQNFLRMLNTIRNIAAHNNVLFKTKLDIKYPYKVKTFYHETLGIEKDEKGEYVSGINDILAIFIILRRFLQRNEYRKMIEELEDALEDVKAELDSQSFENLLETMGLPNDYSKLKEI